MTDRQNIIERIRARARGEPEPDLESRLAAWMQADKATGAPEWSTQDREDALEWLKTHEQPPTVLDLAKFRSVAELYRRYDDLVDRLAQQGQLTTAEADASKKIARSAGVSGVIAEGKLLKQWLDSLEPGKEKSPA